ncbi:unnamed protein product [Dicrocoelium dendriticum]|nr:unnamed protein product [Dicrocoelium dendriticum]
MSRRSFTYNPSDRDAPKSNPVLVKSQNPLATEDQMLASTTEAPSSSGDKTRPSGPVPVQGTPPTDYRRRYSLPATVTLYPGGAVEHPTSVVRKATKARGSYPFTPILDIPESIPEVVPPRSEADSSSGKVCGSAGANELHRPYVPLRSSDLVVPCSDTFEQVLKRMELDHTQHRALTDKDSVD